MKPSLQKLAFLLVLIALPAFSQGEGILSVELSPALSSAPPNCVVELVTVVRTSADLQNVVVTVPAFQEPFTLTAAPPPPVQPPAGWTCRNATGGLGLISAECSMASIAGKTVATFRTKYVVPPCSKFGTSIPLSAVARARAARANEVSANGRAKIAVSGKHAGLVTKIDAETAAGGVAAYRVTVTNNGADTAFDVAIDSPTPPGTTRHNPPGTHSTHISQIMRELRAYLSNPLARPPCSYPAVGAAGKIACRGLSLETGKSYAVGLIVKADASVPPGTSLAISASATTCTPENRTDDNNASTAVTVSGP